MYIKVAGGGGRGLHRRGSEDRQKVSDLPKCIKRFSMPSVFFAGLKLNIKPMDQIHGTGH